MSRKRKHQPPTLPQRNTMERLMALGATSRDSARPTMQAKPIGQADNVLNRMFSRGWVNRTPEPRLWWLTEAGAEALATPLEPYMEAAE